MALNFTSLADNLQAITDDASPSFLGFEPSRDVCASRFVTAYSNYAKVAQDISGDALVLANFGPALIALQDGWRQSNTPSMAAIAMCAAVRAYWVGATFGILIPPLGALPTTQPPGSVFAFETQSSVLQVETSQLQADLVAEFSVLGTGRGKAEALARVLHRATTEQVFCTILGVTAAATPLPCRNVAPIH